MSSLSFSFTFGKYVDAMLRVGKNRLKSFSKWLVDDVTSVRGILALPIISTCMFATLFNIQLQWN